MTAQHINDGGPAFPAPELGQHDYGLPSAYPGMSLRDYFAAKAFRSVIGSLCGPVVSEEVEGDFVRYAEAAYKMADAILRARESA